MSTMLNVFSEGDELPVGTPLMQGHFKIRSILHLGRRAITYLAQDFAGSTVVIKECFPDAFCKRDGMKVVPLSLAARNEFQTIQRQFQSEARMIAKMDHTNIVGIQSIFDENNTSYMVLDHIDGRTLLDVILPSTENGSGKGLAPHQTIDVLSDTLKAVAYMHEQGILHGNICPQNIMVTPDMKPYLIDFRTARPMDNLSNGMPTMRATKNGYSPQEFYIAGGQVGAYSDLYSVAASFYQIITGNRPVDAQNRLKAISRQKPDPYEGLAQNTQEYPTAFCNALDAALSAFPRRRPQAAEDWLDIVSTQRPKGSLISFPNTHSHSPKGTGIYRSPAQ